MLTAASVICAVTSVLLVVLVLSHRGSGGGLSELLGGGGSLNSAAHASRNLTRLSVATAVVWASAVFVVGMYTR